jgi:hypothetical protein
VIVISAYIFSFYNISPFVVSFVYDFISIFVLLAIILVKYKRINFKIFTIIKSVSVIVGALLAEPIGMKCNLYEMKNNLNDLETLLIRQVISFLTYLVLVLFNDLVRHHRPMTDIISNALVKVKILS